MLTVTNYFVDIWIHSSWYESIQVGILKKVQLVQRYLVLFKRKPVILLYEKLIGLYNNVNTLTLGDPEAVGYQIQTPHRI